MVQSTHPQYCNSEYMLNIHTAIKKQFGREFLDNSGLELKDILNLLLISKQKAHKPRFLSGPCLVMCPNCACV